MVAGQEPIIGGKVTTGGKMSDQPAAKKSLGQHWLNDHASLEAICAEAEIVAGDYVLEIGPGQGSLTETLLENEATVFAVEFDPEAVTYLERRFADQPNAPIHIEQGDIRRFDLTKLPKDYKVVANIPYYLTSYLLRLISESPNAPLMAVILVQKEVAERVAARPGSMSLLSVIAQFYWTVSLGLVVPARLFTPPPKVDSQVLVLKRRQKPPFEVDQKLFFQIVKAGFASRRKTLLNSLSGGLRLDKGETLVLLTDSDIDPQKRPQDLSLDDWYSLYKHYSERSE